MGTGVFLLPIVVVLGIVSAVLLAWKRPPREGIGRFWWFLFGTVIAFAGLLLLIVLGTAVLLTGLVIAVLAFCPRKARCERET